MIGLPKSPSVIPVARHKARAPAILRPWVEVADLNLGMIVTFRLIIFMISFILKTPSLKLLLK
ncbi:MAG: hypothetical protein ACI9YH_003253 [Colwellia sp.]